ncbi:MAG: stage III sporulation protein AE [Lachnospiraceae bacterium]|nr:stage III sporulation protein AE [Lachnospiraceae bacterium]
MRHLTVILFSFLLLLLFLAEHVMASSKPETSDEDGKIMSQMEENLELEEIDRSLKEILEYDQFSFRDTVLSLIRGEIPFQTDTWKKLVTETLIREVAQQKTLALQVLLIVLTAAVFSSFTRVFRSSQVADICYYIMYLLVSVLLMQSFGIMNEVTWQAVQSLISMMKVLLPAYLLTIVFCAGTLTASGYSQILLFAFSLTEVFLERVMIPAVNFYLVLLILNQMAKEDYFSKFAELVELAVSWGIRTVFGIIAGLQAVQCLISPAVDSLKNGALHKAAKAIPGIGNTLDAAAETIAGCAVVIKNAVGVAGMAAILVLCLVPVCKLVCCILMLRILSAVIQPVGESRLADCISYTAQASSLLLRILLTAMGIFMISTALITASVKG